MTYAANLYGEGELELELEALADFEGEGFGDPFGDPFADPFAPGDGFGALDRIDAETAALMMDVAAELASEAESEAEADAFLPIIAKLAPMALKALAPLAKTAFTKLAPKLSQSVLGAGRKMLQNFGKKGMAALPDIARGVARDTVQTVANGGQVTGRAVLRSAAQHTLPFLQDPRRAQQAKLQARRRLAQAQRFRRPPPHAYAPQPYGPPGYPPQGWPQPPSPYGPQDYGQSGGYGGEGQFPQQPQQPMGDGDLPQPHYPSWFA